jgi:hypothetical protein
MQDISKPSRHRKRDILPGKTRKSNALTTGIDKSDIFSETDDEDDKSKLKVFTSYGGTGYLCHHCEKEGCGWFCTRYCRNGWHEACKNQDLDVTHDTVTPEVNEEADFDEVMKRIESEWVCKSCKKDEGSCFQCGQKGKYCPPTKSATSMKNRK